MVYLDGKTKYLGPWNSPESKEAYRQVVAEWSGRQLPPDPPKPANVAPRALTIAEALLQYKLLSQGSSGCYGTRTEMLPGTRLKPWAESVLMPRGQSLVSLPH
jgi:hypothetical protein